MAALKSAGYEDPSYWVRDAGTFQCRYNRKMADPTNGVSATHYVTPGDYTLQDGLGGTHNVICEKVMDQYKAEREICESDRTLGLTDSGEIIQIKNDIVCIYFALCVIPRELNKNLNLIFFGQ